VPRQNIRLRWSALILAAKPAPNHAAMACAGAMQAQMAQSMLPIWVGCIASVAMAATMVAGMLTTMPAAAARPTLLCIGNPDSVITMFGEDAAAHAGEAGESADAQARNMAEPATRRPLHKRLEPLRKGEPDGKHETQETEQRGQ